MGLTDDNVKDYKTEPVNDSPVTDESYFDRQVREVLEQRKQQLPLVEHMAVLLEFLVCQLAGIRDELFQGNEIMDREPEVEQTTDPEEAKQEIKNLFDRRLGWEQSGRHG